MPGNLSQIFGEASVNSASIFQCPLWVISGYLSISERAKVAIDTKCSIELGRHRERLGRIDDEHYEGV